ncbi:MAG: CBS domain-containing protein, partial [Planctomycetales bacterium]|nr:CBS domain-containing protein [Planctomycetales bacterium]
MNVSDESTRMIRVADVMTRDVLTVTSLTPIGKVLELMESKHVSALPVVDDDKCVGIVTATDLVKLIRETNAALRSGYPHYEDCLWAVDLSHRKLDQQPVREIMSVFVDKVSPQTLICEAAKHLSTCAKHHLVVEEEGKLVGFLS